MALRGVGHVQKRAPIRTVLSIIVPLKFQRRVAAAEPMKSSMHFFAHCAFRKATYVL